MNRILALVSAKIFPRIASCNQYTKQGRIRTRRSATPLRAGSTMALAGALVFASGHGMAPSRRHSST